MEDQLNRNIEIPRKRIPWVKYFFQFALPTFLISMRASAQKPVKKIVTEICSKTVGDTIVRWNPGEKNEFSLPLLRPLEDHFVEVTLGKTLISSPENIQTIKGKIIEEEGNPIPFER